MDLDFLDRPGRRERHLQRRHLNPLFGLPPPQVGARELEQARQADQEELARFRDDFGTLVQEATQLGPGEADERVLNLKERLDQAYEQACGLAGDPAQFKEALRRLVGRVVQALGQGEDVARRLHYALAEQPLVADLLAPDTPIGPDELLPSLLGASAAEVEAALHLFDPEQLALLMEEGRALAARLEQAGVPIPAARERLGQLQERLSLEAPTPALH